MSLYDMYFSKKNKNFMFETLSKVIFQETNTQIINDDKYINIYRLNYPTIFEQIDTDELSFLNKEVINIIGELIINDIKNNINKPLINNINIPINDTNININDIPIIPISQKILLYSSQRNINSKNRYDFNLNVNFNIFTPKYITLPKEENLIFSNPNINILFNNTDNLLFTLKETQKFGNLEYYIYETFTDTKIKCSNILDIKIKNYLMNSPIVNYDIFYIHNIKKIAQNYLLTNLSEIDLNKNYSCIQMNKNITLNIEK